jgi:hypothetical protein
LKPTRFHAGTGQSLLLDGHDVAMLRASVVDADGTVSGAIDSIILGECEGLL